jgi:nucleotide-binding universal stress UspA family protein
MGFGHEVGVSFTLRVDTPGGPMHVLVATDGSIDIDKAADFALALAGDGGRTTVSTVVRVPRRLVAELRAQYGDQPPVSVDSDAEYVGAPRTPDTLERGWPGDDALVDRYLGDKRVEICKPLVEAIRLRGGEATSTAVEGDEVDETLLGLTTELDVDVIIVGSHGGNAFAGLLGSTGSKMVRRSPVPVLVIR